MMTPVLVPRIVLIGLIALLAWGIWASARLARCRARRPNKLKSTHE